MFEPVSVSSTSGASVDDYYVVPVVDDSVSPVDGPYGRSDSYDAEFFPGRRFGIHPEC